MTSDNIAEYVGENNQFTEKPVTEYPPVIQDNTATTKHYLYSNNNIDADLLMVIGGLVVILFLMMLVMHFINSLRHKELTEILTKISFPEKSGSSPVKPEAVSCNLLSLCVLAPVFCTPKKLAEVSREIIVSGAHEIAWTPGSSRIDGHQAENITWAISSQSPADKYDLINKTSRVSPDSGLLYEPDTVLDHRERVLDHANRILHLDQTWMFLAGRGAFPLFALVWGLNLSRHTHIRQEAINRLWGWAVIAQFAYYLAGFPWYEGNILFAFAVAAQVLTWCETRTWWRSAETMLLLAMWLPFSGTSYGIAGLLMLAVSHRLYRAEDRMERLTLVACLLAVIPALNLATSDAAAVAGLVMTVLTVGLVSCAGKSLPRFWPGDFFPTFYACHLAVLGVLAL